MIDQELSPIVGVDSEHLEGKLALNGCKRFEALYWPRFHDGRESARYGRWRVDGEGRLSGALADLDLSGCRRPAFELVDGAESRRLVDSACSETEEPAFAEGSSDKIPSNPTATRRCPSLYFFRDNATTQRLRIRVGT